MEEFNNIEDSALWGNRHRGCPPSYERSRLKQDWTCDEYESFNDLEASYQLIGLISKGYQCIVFTVLLILLGLRRYGAGDSAQLSIIPLIITLLVLLEGIMTILRINAVFPLTNTATANMKLMVLFQCFAIFFFLCSQWIFGLKYYETAVEIRLML